MTLLALLAFALTAPAEPETVWDTPAKLSAWIESAKDAPAPETDGSVLRIHSPRAAVIRSPGCRPWDPFTCAAFFHVRDRNAIQITLRHNMSWDHLGGYWFYSSTDPGRWDFVPQFDAHPVPGDGAWHEVTLKLSESPYFEPQGVTLLCLRPFQSRGGKFPSISAYAEAAPPMAEGEYLEVARIELIHVEEKFARPAIRQIHPGAARRGEVVTISGFGFAEPATRNLVLFGDGKEAEAEVLSGDASSLRVRVAGSSWEGEVTVRVRTPGGGVAMYPTAFILFRGGLYKCDPDLAERRVPAGSEVPLSVRVSDRGRGVPGEKVQFRIGWGEGTLLATEVPTDEDGTARTRLKLSGTIGPTVVDVAGPFVQLPLVVLSTPNRKRFRLPAIVEGDHTYFSASTRAFDVPWQVENICQRVLEDPSPALRSAAAAILGAGYSKQTTTVPKLVSALEDHDASVRLSAAVSLGWLGSEGALKVAAAKDPDARVRLAAALGVEYHEGREPTSVILEGLKDPDVRLRVLATAALVSMVDRDQVLIYRNPQVLPLLRGCVKDPAPGVKITAFQGLEHFPTWEWIWGACTDPDERVRAAAAKTSHGSLCSH